MDQQPTNLPPADWYDDPDAPGRQRWFDGSGWTELRRAAPRDDAAPATETVAAAVPQAAVAPAPVPAPVEAAAQPATYASAASGSTIAIDWRPTGWSLVWSWILMWIPTILMAVRAHSTSYTLHGGTFVARTGLTTKHTTNVDVYRIKTVDSVDSVFGGNSVTVTMADGSVHRFGLIRHASHVAQQLRTAASEERDRKGTTYRETL